MCGARAMSEYLQYPVRGIDVSHYQGAVDWAAVAGAGMRFAFVKATEGVSVSDPAFGGNWDGARAAGLVRGAYHYLHPDESGAAQGEHFVSRVRIDASTLPPALDVEVTKGKSPAEVAAVVADWIGVVEKAFGTRPILYTAPDFWRDDVGADFRSYPLWLACYDSVPRMPPFWDAWTFWQFSQSGRVEGIGGAVDVNVFSGTAGALAKLCVGGAAASA